MLMSSEQDQIRDEIFDTYGIDINLDKKSELDVRDNSVINAEKQNDDFNGGFEDSMKRPISLTVSRLHLLLIKSLVEERVKSLHQNVVEYKHLGELGHILGQLK